MDKRAFSFGRNRVNKQTVVENNHLRFAFASMGRIIIIVESTNGQRRNRPVDLKQVQLATQSPPSSSPPPSPSPHPPRLNLKAAAQPIRPGPLPPTPSEPHPEGPPPPRLDLSASAEQIQPVHHQLKPSQLIAQHNLSLILLLGYLIISNDLPPRKHLRNQYGSSFSQSINMPVGTYLYGDSIQKKDDKSNLIMLLLRAKRYNLLLNSLMPRDEISLLSNKYLLTNAHKPTSNQHASSSFPHKEEIALLLRNKYNLSLTPKPPAPPKKEKEVAPEGKTELKFEIKPPKGTRDYYPQQMAIRRKVIDTIVSVFKKHGGVELDTPVFELKEVLTGKYGEDSKLIYDLEDQGGERCSLRYDLTVPFARFMANNTNIQKIKRFHIGKVYRRDQPTITKGRFREFYQCDFDIAGKYDAMIPDAEVLAIMQEILQALGIEDFLVKVNHRKILEVLIQEAGCDPAMFKTICSSIDKLDKLPWAEVEAELKTKGVNADQCKVIERLTALKGQPISLLQEMISKNVFQKEGASLTETFADMKKLFSYLAAMKRLKKVSFDMSLARGLDYYTGVIYEIVLTDKKTELGSISGGGRYDNLIGMFCQHQIPAVGGSLGIERLFTILEGRYKNKAKQNECQILVATIGKIPVETKLAVLSELWSGNIKAETMYLQKGKPDKQIGHAFDNQIPMILWLGQEEVKAGEAKLKILYKHEEVKVKLENIAQNLAAYVQAFRKDYAQGKVVLEDPKKVKK